MNPWRGKPVLPVFVIVLVLLSGLSGPYGCGGRPWEAREDLTRSAEAPLLQVPEAVPGPYRPLYREVAEELEKAEDYLAEHRDDIWGETILSTELIPANSNRGEVLLQPATFSAVQLALDRLYELGVRGITLGINYPVLEPDFPRSAEYLDFFRRTAREAKKRGFILIVETTSTFRDPCFSNLKVDYSGLTTEEFRCRKRRMAEIILRELQPDYLTVENEPGTQAANTGLPFSVQDYLEEVNYVLEGLERGPTKIGAGAGSWDDLAYFQKLAAETSLDYLDVHVYPVQGDLLLNRLPRVAEIARSNGKGVSVGEAWLYKASREELSEGQNVAAAADIFARDAFSFWAPLDQAFLETMCALSRHLDLEFFSPFWMQIFYAYLDYRPSLERSGFAALQAELNSRAWENMRAGILSPTGEAYRRAIEE